MICSLTSVLNYLRIMLNNKTAPTFSINILLHDTPPPDEDAVDGYKVHCLPDGRVYLCHHSFEVTFNDLGHDHQDAKLTKHTASGKHQGEIFLHSPSGKFKSRWVSKVPLEIISPEDLQTIRVACKQSKEKKSKEQDKGEDEDERKKKEAEEEESRQKEETEANKKKTAEEERLAKEAEQKTKTEKAAEEERKIKEAEEEERKRKQKEREQMKAEIMQELERQEAEKEARKKKEQKKTKKERLKKTCRRKPKTRD